MIDADAKGRPVWRSFNSCLTPLALVHGREIVTVEGLGNAGLHPVQQCMVANHGSQCGYCTPGMIMNAYGLLKDNPEPSRDQIVDGMERNLCRCGAHQRIVAAIEEAAQKGGAS